VKTAINQLYDGSPTDEQDMALYEEVPDLKAQYVNSPPPADSTPKVGSVLVNNPIYGDENENNAKFDTAGDRFNGYDRTTFQRPTPQASDSELYIECDLLLTII
jgi:hypothetical protein